MAFVEPVCVRTGSRHSVQRPRRSFCWAHHRVRVQGRVWLSGASPIRTLSEKLLEKATSGYTPTHLRLTRRRPALEACPCVCHSAMMAGPGGGSIRSPHSRGRLLLPSALCRRAGSCTVFRSSPDKDSLREAFGKAYIRLHPYTRIANLSSPWANERNANGSKSDV